MASSRLPLVIDLASAWALVWLASWGRDGELTPEAHLYFFDRYSRLAEWHRTRGHFEKARRFETKAEMHHVRDSGGGPPYAAAMAMPRPRRLTVTNAVSTRRFDGPNDAA